ncbi:MAG: MarR family transcriptional regulator [Rikenellaceae bacterium]
MEKIIKIREIQHSIELFERELEGLYRLSISELMVVMSLSGVKQLSASEIAQKCSLSPSNTSKVLKNLEQKYLIERKIGVVDKRKMNFTITKEGKSLLSRMNYGEIQLPELLADIVLTCK